MSHRIPTDSTLENAPLAQHVSHRRTDRRSRPQIAGIDVVQAGLSLIAAGALTLSLSGCGNASPALADAGTAALAVETAASATAGRQIPAGTVLRIELEDGLRSRVAEPGQSFRARLSQHLVLDGEIVLPEGAAVTGKITAVNRAEAAGQRPSLTIAFDTLRPFFGESYDIHDAALVGRLSNLPRGVTVVDENTLAGAPMRERDVATSNVALASYIASDAREGTLIVPTGSVLALTLAMPIDLEPVTAETAETEPVA